MSLRSGKKKKLRDRELFVESVEPRYLLSADAFGFDSHVSHHDDWNPGDDSAQDTVSWWQNLEKDKPHEYVKGKSQQADSIALRREIVLLDAGVEDGEQLLADLLAENDVSAVQVYLIDSSEDGISQITEILGAETNLGTAHVISHGNVGELRLGNTSLSSANLAVYAEQIKSWGEAFADGGDILLYGCELASDISGQALVDSVSILTGTDIAASSDYTGSADQGADWQLEYEHGDVSSRVISPGSTSSWNGVLGTISVTTFNDIADGGDTSSISNLIANPGSDGISLREAIIASNNDVGQEDSIILSAGTYTLSIAGADEDMAATGDLDILDPLIIIGAGADQTVIDGARLDRVFHVVKSDTAISVSISDLKIQNGFVNESGAGLLVGINSAGATVIVSNVWVSDNESVGVFHSGGGIFNRGNLTVQDSLIEGNVARDGGGVMNFFDGDLNLINVTLSGNEAFANHGGGAFNLETARYTNTTVVQITALSNGGGLYNSEIAGAITNIENTLVAGNTAESNPDVFGRHESDAGGNLIQTTGNAYGLHMDDITGVDPDIGSLSDNGGSTHTHALLAGSAAANRGVHAVAPLADQRGVMRNDSLPDIGAFEIANEASFSSMLLTTQKDVSASGVAGLGSWNASELLEFGGPSWSLGSGTTSGQLATFLDFGAMGLSPDRIDAIHRVGVDMTVGGSNSIDLKSGDLLMSVDKNGSTLTSTNSITVDKSDIFLYRPDMLGNYSEGTFTLLLDGMAFPEHVDSISLVEERTLVGDVVLERGDFIGSSRDNSIFRLSLFDVGTGTTSGVISELIDGDNIGIDEDIAGVELIEASTTVGGIDLAVGQLVVTLLKDDDSVGNFPEIATTSQDVLVMDVSTTGLGTTAATLTLLLDGDNIGLDSKDEAINGLAFVPLTPVNEQVITTNAGHTVAEGSLGTVITSAMLETTDVDNTATELVYTVTALPVNGHVNLSGTALSVNDTFTQSDIDNNRITYDHDGTDTADDSIGFSVDDGTGVVSTGAFAIT
ncbi:MAG: DUF4347 domain-containing protein, partial [Granulosicoccus sp.]